MNEVFTAEPLEEIFRKLDRSELIFIDKIRRELLTNLKIGKPLRYSWFREKRIKGKRLYFLINLHSSKAIVVGYGDKKEQQRIINHILMNKEKYLRQISGISLFCLLQLLLNSALAVR